jgi:hypothetical protein
MSTLVLDGEELVSFAEAARLLPRRRGGARCATSTIWRWSTRGSRGVVLRVVRVGGHVYTSPAWLSEFIERRSAVDRAPQCPAPTTASQRAIRELDRMGM